MSDDPLEQRRHVRSRLIRGFSGPALLGRSEQGGEVELPLIGAEGGAVSYLHNDIDARPDSDDERQRCLENGWDVNDADELQRWRDQEPINAHSHLAAVGARPRRPAIVAPAQLVSRGSANGSARAL